MYDQLHHEVTSNFSCVTLPLYSSYLHLKLSPSYKILYERDWKWQQQERNNTHLQGGLWRVIFFNVMGYFKIPSINAIKTIQNI